MQPTRLTVALERPEPPSPRKFHFLGEGVMSCVLPPPLLQEVISGDFRRVHEDVGLIECTGKPGAFRQGSGVIIRVNDPEPVALVHDGLATIAGVGDQVVTPSGVTKLIVADRQLAAADLDVAPGLIVPESPVVGAPCLSGH